MIYLAMFIGLVGCLLAAIKLVDLGFSHAHRPPSGERSRALNAILFVGWIATFTLALLISGTAVETLKNLDGLFLYGDLVELMRALLGY